MSAENLASLGILYHFTRGRSHWGVRRSGGFGIVEGDWGCDLDVISALVVVLSCWKTGFSEGIQGDDVEDYGAQLSINDGGRNGGQNF